MTEDRVVHGRADPQVHTAGSGSTRSRTRNPRRHVQEIHSSTGPQNHKSTDPQSTEGEEGKIGVGKGVVDWRGRPGGEDGLAMAASRG
jgi:hypothetical protein